MAGSFPTSPGFTNVQLRLDHKNLVSESVTGRIQVRNRSVKLRFWTITFPVMTRATFEPIYEFVDLQKGSFETFTITIPDPSDPNNDETVTVRLDGPVQEMAIGKDNLYRFEMDIREEV